MHSAIGPAPLSSSTKLTSYVQNYLSSVQLIMHHFHFSLVHQSTMINANFSLELQRNLERSCNWSGEQHFGGDADWDGGVGVAAVAEAAKGGQGCGA
jgi:hypothetical protein